MSSNNYVSTSNTTTTTMDNNNNNNNNDGDGDNNNNNNEAIFSIQHHSKRNICLSVHTTIFGRHQTKQYLLSMLKALTKVGLLAAQTSKQQPQKQNNGNIKHVHLFLQNQFAHVRHTYMFTPPLHTHTHTQTHSHTHTHA